MSTRSVEIKLGGQFWKGLAMNDLRFHHCMAELVDNAVAATPPGVRFNVELGIFEVPGEGANSPRRMKFYLGDCGRGMSEDQLEEVLNPGFDNGSDNGLNEHGWGLKNALCTMSRDLAWRISSRTDSGKFASVSSRSKFP